MKNTVIDKLLTEVESAEKENSQTLWFAIWKFFLFISTLVLFLLIILGLLYLENIYLLDKSFLIGVVLIDLSLILVFGILARCSFKKRPDAFDSVCEHLKSYLNCHYKDASKVAELVMSEISKERENAQKKFESIFKIMSLLPMLFFTNAITDFMKDLVEEKVTANSYIVLMLLIVVYLLSRGVGYIIVSYIKNPAFGKKYKKICLYRYLSVVKYKALERDN
ncbi:hypothetical protein [Streptococcus salivarius]|uniref:hypothetical protein n=1 Tax=Streptococcus salivarius TaxID=1304 RepID=UPI0022DF3686|nr:hypothetical protein [Streptococcus salivarius]